MTTETKNMIKETIESLICNGNHTHRKTLLRKLDGKAKVSEIDKCLSEMHSEKRIYLTIEDRIVPTF